MAEMIAISLSVKVAAALSRTAAASLVPVRPGIAAAARDLELLRAFLRFADSHRGADVLANAWVEQVRDVGFELEDIVDEYTFLSASGGFLRACADVMAWFALSSRLRKARDRLRALSAVKEQYGIRPAEASAPPDGGTGTGTAAVVCRKISEAAHFVEEGEIVGLAAHTRLLMKWLTVDAKSRRMIIAVCGMGGVGKTTLATNVYKRIAKSCHFDCAAWVAVSKNFTTDDLLRRILKELHRDVQAGGPWDADEMDSRSLVEALRGHLAQKRYFLLLDDVWDADAWFQLRGALLDSGTGSRIVNTTRSREVAALASSSRTIMLEPLPEQEAWSLFCSTTFREDADRECPYHLQHWASKILDRCCGLPLAIKSVGNLLALKEKTEFAWKNVHDRLVWDESGDHGIGQVSTILNVSIDDLPYHLKRCFLYCSVYPEDYFIRRKVLIRQWIAEGLIEEKGHGTMEEVADGYVNELVQHNLLLVALKNEFGHAKRLHIHDLIREVIAHRSKEERFLELSGSTRVDSKQKIRHLTLDNCQIVHQSAPNLASLRSFYVLRSELDASLFSDFRLLAVLNLWFINTNKLPSAVADLHNLRYLGIRSTFIEELPKELGKLHNLQTLDAKWSMIKILPSSIAKLKNLRHLILFRRRGTDLMDPRPGTAIALPDGVKNLRCLQTLKFVQADQKVVRSLGSFEQMRSLELFGVDERILVDLPSALSKMSCLLRLGIISFDANATLDMESFSPPPVKLKTLSVTGKLARGKLPSWFGSLTNLTQLHLRSSELREDSIAILSSLPRLLHLSLINAYTQRRLTFAAGCFPVLRQLSLQCLPNLASIEFRKESLVDLRLLTLDHCPIVLKKMDCTHYRSFRFENHWIRFHGFSEVVSMAWAKEVQSGDPIRVLHTKLSRTARALRLWNKQHTRWAVFVSAVANDVIFSLDLAQEERPLSAEERQLRDMLKAKLLGIAAVDRARWRQKSRLTEIRDGDASTRFFHLRASGRRRKNHIPKLNGSAGEVHDHAGKAKILLQRFKGLMGVPCVRSANLNWDRLGLPRRDLEHLDGPFTEQELLAAVKEIHGEKAPGPDGYTGTFFKHCWAIVKEDLLAAVNCVHSLRGQNWKLLNTANLFCCPNVLMPKMLWISDL